MLFTGFPRMSRSRWPTHTAVSCWPCTEGSRAFVTSRAVDEAYERLREDIFRGELLPNERLVEIDLAERLQVSRAVVRTALVRLGQDGIVTLTPHRGARVRLVTDAEA